MSKQHRKLYRTKYHNLEDMDPRALEMCMQCGCCLNDHRIANGVQGVCPIYRHGTQHFETNMPRGRLQAVRALMENRLEPSQAFAESVFLCTTCASCYETCHNPWHEQQDNNINRVKDHVSVWESLRADLMKLGFAHPEGHRILLGSLANYDNPWGQPRRAKANWARKTGTKGKNLGKKMEPVDVLLFTGCTAPLDQTIEDVVLATGQVLDMAGVNWGFLGEKEICCGSVTKRVGELDVFNDLAKRNVALLNDLHDKYGVKTIVTSCAGCFKTLFQDYYALARDEEDIDELKPEVVHTATYAKRLLDEGKIDFTNGNGLEAKVTYHDPCHLGRHCHVYEAPRDIMDALPGVELTEMYRNKSFALCCGAGGGMKSGFPNVAQSIGIERVEEAEKTESDYVVSTCPFCEQNIRDAIKGNNSKLKVVDLVQLIAIGCGARENGLEAVSKLPGAPKGTPYGGD